MYICTRLIVHKNIIFFSMKKLFLLIIAIFFLDSCKDEVKPKVDVSTISVQFQVERFDQIFYESKPEDFPKIRKQYPFLFPEQFEDSVFVNKLNDPVLREVYDEVQLKYKTLETLVTDIEQFLKYTKHYFPETKTPRVFTTISDFDLESKAVYSPDYLFISLDCYLGKDNRIYESLYDYTLLEREPDQILPDIVSSFSYGRIAPPKNKNLLSFMIYKGKELYLKDILIPDVPDHVKIAYTEMQNQFCLENESQIWSVFIEEKYLFDSNPMLEQRFMKPAPFSKFYREIDNETPGRIGQWIGWQIVRSYMQNNPETKIQDLLAMDAKELFENSKYKPKK